MSDTRTLAAADIVQTSEEAAAQEREPLLVLDPLEAFLDRAGLGAGPLDVSPIGDGHSNVTYAIGRGEERFVLRRPPRGPLAPSTHDVLREARLIAALRPAGVRVPEVLAVCAEDAVIGAPFYMMELLDGEIVGERLPAALDAPAARKAIGEEVVDALVELHAVDVERAGTAGFGRPSGYLGRQVRRFAELLERNATRRLPELERLADWLGAATPPAQEATVVHGDYRLGNLMFGRQAPPRLLALLDWELATLGDPLADVGYLTAMWADPDDPPNPMLDLSRTTRLRGFPDRDALARRYARESGRDLGALRWYQVLALWKAAIFLEGSYKRYLAGSTDDDYFARLGEGVPELARAAARIAAGS